MEFKPCFVNFSGRCRIFTTDGKVIKGSPVLSASYDHCSKLRGTMRSYGYAIHLEPSPIAHCAATVRLYSNLPNLRFKFFKLKIHSKNIHVLYMCFVLFQYYFPHTGSFRAKLNIVYFKVLCYIHHVYL